MLQNLGVKASFAFNGELAVEMVENGNYDMIFMDIQMPKMDGYSAVKAIRAKNTTVPIIALTAQADIETQDHILSVGCNDCINKPLERESLIEFLNKHLAVVN